MAVPANFDSPDRDKYRYCHSRLMKFVYTDEETCRTDLNLLLDQLNSLEYSSLLVREQDGNQLLVRLCGLVPLHEERLVVKLCQITNNLKRKQMLVLHEDSIDEVVGYFIKAILRCPAWTRPDILHALASVLYENCDKATRFHNELLGKQGIFVQLINDDVTDTDTLKEAVLCMECLTLRPSTSGYLSAPHTAVCFDVFTMLLHKMPDTKLDQMTQCKILINCLRGIQNMLQVTKIMPVERLGVVLAAIRAYLFFGLFSQPTVVPERLYQSPLTQTDIPDLGKMSATPDEKSHTDKEDNSGQQKKKKKTKKKTDKKTDRKDPTDKDDASASPGTDNQSATTGAGADSALIASLTPAHDFGVTSPPWAKISSSESDWSDTEGGQASRLRSSCTKVRQCALSCFFWIIKTTDKKLMFSFWSSFIPDCQTTTNQNNMQTLFTIILKDPSPKCRMGALAALSVLVDGTKLLLSVAEDTDITKTTTFTPFSVILGSIIKEIHRCLLLAMVSEDYPITLTQLIKCFGTIIYNVPYHRMQPGLLSRIVKQIRHFLNHRDPNVRVACLTCLGAIAKIQPPLMEVCHIVMPSRPPVSSRTISVTSETTSHDLGAQKDADSCQPTPTGNRPPGQDSGFSSGQSIIGCVSLALGSNSQNTSGSASPVKGAMTSPGIQTPVFSDQLLQAHAREISWVVKLCVKNILPQSGDRDRDMSRDGGRDRDWGREGGRDRDGGGSLEEPHTEPLPVRLESLQVLANLTKGYFSIIRNCVPLLQELVHSCYCDKDPVIKLHTAKLLDEFTQVLLQDLQTKDEGKLAVERLDKQQVLDFWLSLLNGPVQEILQNPSHGAVRATTCDCIANIGNDIFVSLPTDKRVMCLTVVLGLTNDEDRFIRASAIRTLGVYVLYKSLREDVSFITDATTAVLDAIDDKNLAVRVKAAWSLANLCDSLALNKEEGDAEFLAEFPDMLVLNVITMATKACLDNDKIKANGVRALGNILRYLSLRCLGKETFTKAVGEGIKALVKNVSTGAMKVRWNACYAVSNMFKNADLSSGAASWNADVLGVLCNVVRDCKNFKVRINAAVALSSPQQRIQYGSPAVYVGVWQGVIDAFTTAEDIADFIDYRYRDTLTDQICSAVLHLVSLVQHDDLSPLLPLLRTSGDQLLVSMDKYITSRQKDLQIASKLPIAMATLDKLTASSPSDDQSACLEILTAMCRQLMTASEEGEMKPHPKPVFDPTYD